MKLKKRKGSSFLYSIIQNNLFGVAAGVLLLDQVSKFLALRFLPFVCNGGAAFGIPAGGLIFSAIVLTIVLVVMFYENSKRNVLALGLIFVGGLSNFIDRVLFGCVRDFIDFRVFPVFNFADVAISLGVIFVIYNLLNSKNEA